MGGIETISGIANFDTRISRGGVGFVPSGLLKYDFYIKFIVGRSFQVDLTSKIRVVDTSAGPISQINPTTGEQETTAAETPFVVYEKGITSLGAFSQYLTTPSTPANQTTASLGTGFYTLEMIGAGSVAISAGTATITGAGSATEGTPVIVEVTGAGTVNVVITGVCTRFQLYSGANSLYPIYIDSAATAASSSGTSSSAITAAMLDRLDGVADGVDINTDANAIGIINETDTTTGWTEASAVLTSQNSITANSAYAFLVTSTGSGRIHKNIQDDFSLVNGVRYAITFYIRHSGTAAGTGVWLSKIGPDNSGTGIAILTSVNKTNITFQKVTYSFTHITDTTKYLVFREFNPEDDGGVYLDNLSIESLLPAQGQIHGSFTPWVSADDMDDGTYNIASTNETATGNLQLVKSGATRTLDVTDGTNTASITLDWLKDIEYEYDIFWGWNDAAAKWAMYARVRAVGATTWIESAVTDFTGRWPIDTTENKLVYGFGAGEYPISTGELTIQPLNQPGWSKVAL